MRAANSLHLEQDPRSIVGTRLFDAPRELVVQTMARLAGYVAAMGK